MSTKSLLPVARRTALAAAAAVLVLLGAVQPSAAVTFFTDFNSGVLDPNLTASSTSSAFTMTLSGGEVFLNKAAGVGSGSIFLSTTFTGFGDFTTTVSARRILGGNNGESGVAASSTVPGGGFGDIFFIGEGGINGNIFYPGTGGAVPTANATDDVKFRLSRVGLQIFEEVDSGSGFVLINQASVTTADPVTFSLFDLQEFGDGSQQSFAFDNWSITAEDFVGFTPPAGVPEPASLGLLATGLAAVWFARRLRR